MAKVVEVNCTTGEVTERDLTKEEIAQMKADAEAFEKKEAERKAEEDRVAALKESAKVKLVAGEALTEEEASVLVI